MGNRTWLAVILCLGVWMAYIRFLAPPLPEQPQQQQQAQAPNQPTQVAPSQGQNSNSPFPSTASKAATSDKALFQQAASAKISGTLDTEGAEFSFAENGGRLAGVKLKKFTQTIDKDSPPIAPVSLEETPFTFATIFTDQRLKEFEGGVYSATAGQNRVTFEKAAQGAKISKSYEIGPSDYLLNVSYRIDLPQSKNAWGDMLIPMGGKDQVFEFQDPLKAWEVIASQNSEVQRWTLEDLPEKPETFQGVTEWLAFGNRYFAAALLNNSKLNPDVIVLNDPSFKGAYLRFPLRGQSPFNFQFQYYVGPKEYAELQKISTLSGMIDFGWFSFMAYPLLWLLQFFYKYVANYGVAIVLLTILVRVVFYPLTAKSMKSMKQMQKLGPEIKKLKEKYGDDREKFSREQMQLFKTHKVNPAAGCLPMLIQMPVFIALYQVLNSSMELFHAPFFGWIADLSAKDPYYIYPVLMGVTMFIQQKITPNAGMDPMQQKMMLIMPVVFSFIMLNLPSGLTLYIFVSTLLGIVQQYLQTRETKNEEAVALKA